MHTLSHAPGLGGMSGAQGKAAEIAGAVSIIAEVDISRIMTRYNQGWISCIAESCAEAVRLAQAHIQDQTACAIAYHGNVVDLLEHLIDQNIHVDLISDQTSCHVPYDGGYCPQGISFEERTRMLAEDSERFRKLVNRSLQKHYDCICKLHARGAFTVEESRQILLAGLLAGLKPKCHSDEIDTIGGTEMAASVSAVSCDHLIRCTDAGIDAMVHAGTIACCLPATSFYLNAPFALARKMIQAGVPVAFGSDFNPDSCPSHSLQLAMKIGCYKYGMTPEECLTAVTLNAAAAIGRSEHVGTLERGKLADIVIWNASNLDYLFYHFGDNMVKTTIKKGKVKQ